MAASETYSKFFLRDYHAECHTILLEQRKNQSMLNLNSIFVPALLELIKLEKEKLESINVAILHVLRELVYEVKNIDKNNLIKIALFGSYAKRTYTQNSDVDVALIVKDRNPAEELLITEIVDRLEKRFGKEIQTHYLTENDFLNNTKLVNEIKKDGVVIFP